MARTKKTLIEVPNKEAAQALLHDYAQSSSELKRIESAAEKEIQAVRDKHQSEITSLKEEMKMAFERIQAYATANRREAFGTKKSQDWTHRVIGFRIGQPRAKVRGGFRWADVLENLKANQLLQFVRTKEDVHKDKIIASREDAKVMEKLKAVGVEVIQEESFFIDIKEEQYA
jgi:phage host-nuclease inhibitor protein Gam